MGLSFMQEIIVQLWEKKVDSELTPPCSLLNAHLNVLPHWSLAAPSCAVLSQPNASHMGLFPHPMPFFLVQEGWGS